MGSGFGEINAYRKILQIPNYKRQTPNFKHQTLNSELQTMTHTLIEKEKLQTLHFVNQEVLNEASARHHRNFLLNEAMMLGNDYKQKVKIVFQSTAGIYAVETTVWAVTDSHIELKAGKDMPIHCILDVVI